MPFLLRTTITCLLAFGLVASACGDDVAAGGDEPGESPATVDGREFWSTDVVTAGEATPLIDGTRIQLRFDGNGLGASAGCNQLGGDYAVDGARLVVGSMFMTEMGCDPDRHAQDDFVVGFLTATPTIALDGDTLVLTAADTTITLLDRVVADPDQPLVGPVWEVTGFFDDDTAWSHAVEVPATLHFVADTLEVVDDCGSTSLPAAHDDGAQVAVTPPDAWPACFAEPPAATTDLRRALEAGTLAVTIDGPRLRLVTSTGRGITAVAR